MDIGNIFLLSAIGYLGFICKAIPLKLINYIILKTSFSVSTTSRDTSVYMAVNEWLFHLKNPTLMNNINARKEWVKSRNQTCFSINYGNYFLWLKPFTICILQKSLIENNWHISDKIDIRIFGFRKNYKKQLLDAVKENEYDSNIHVYPLPEIWENFTIPMKSFDDIFTANKHMIIDHLESWKKSKVTYDNHGIIYKTGILLHGKPGTGKTSIAKAIASYMKYDLHVINVQSYTEESQLISRIANVHENSIVLFEDIDCLLQNRNEEDKTSEKDTKRQALLGTVLNIIDGAMSPQNVIFVATTNYIEKLDQALIRDGRFDLKVKIEDIDKDLATMMCDRYDAPHSILEDEYFPINPSHLQNKILSSIT